MKTHRQYKWELHLLYDQFYETALKNSAILSGNSDYQNTSLVSKQSLEWQRETLIGNDAGLHDGLPATIPELKDKIKTLNKDFEAYKTRCMKEGKPVPEEPPKDQLKELYKAEALCDLHSEELDKIDHMINTFVGAKEINDDADVLRNGPKGIGKLTGGVLVMVDGQKVTLGRGDITFIDDNRSRYNGLSTANYFTKVVRPWRILCAKSAQETEKLINDGTLNANTLSAGKKRGSNVPWPEWPEGCTNHKQDTESSGIRRTK